MKHFIMNIVKQDGNWDAVKVLHSYCVRSFLFIENDKHALVIFTLLLFMLLFANSSTL